MKLTSLEYLPSFPRRGIYKAGGAAEHRSQGKEQAHVDGNVDFEGRKVRVVSISARTGMDTPYSAHLDLDLGEEYVVLLGYFRGGEFIEEGRERPL